MNARDELAALLKNTFKTPYLADDWLKQNGPAVLALIDAAFLIEPLEGKHWTASQATRFNRAVNRLTE